MPHMLRHIPTGDLYIATAALLARGDMETVAQEPVVVTPVKTVVRRKPAAKAEPVLVLPDDEPDLEI